MFCGNQKFSLFCLRLSKLSILNSTLLWSWRNSWRLKESLDNIKQMVIGWTSGLHKNVCNKEYLFFYHEMQKSVIFQNFIIGYSL